MKADFEEVACPLHGKTDEFLTSWARGELVGVFCQRCLADFIKQHVGEATPVYPSAKE